MDHLDLKRYLNKCIYMEEPRTGKYKGDLVLGVVEQGGL